MLTQGLRRLIFILSLILLTLLLLNCAVLGQSNYAVSERIKQLAPFVVPIKGAPDWVTGTGVLVKLPKGGTGIITNQHVCEAVLEQTGTISTIINGAHIGGLKIVKWSVVRDLCLLMSNRVLPMEGLEVVPADTYEFGEQFLVLGHPVGRPLSAQVGRYMTERVLEIGKSTLTPECKVGTFANTPFGMICLIPEVLEMTTILIYPGNSGSPVFNSTGQLIGIVNSADNYTSQGNFIKGKIVAQFLKGI